MNKRITVKLITCAIVALALTAYCYESSAAEGQQAGTRYTPPPNVHPPPQPTKQLIPEISFHKWKSKDVVQAFKNTGLEVEGAKPAFILSPIAPKEGIMFLIPSFGTNIGGYVSSYNSGDELKAYKNYYLKMNKNPESPAWWIFEKDNILLLISGKVPVEKAREYEKVLNQMDRK